MAAITGNEVSISFYERHERTIKAVTLATAAMGIYIICAYTTRLRDAFDPNSLKITLPSLIGSTVFGGGLILNCTLQADKKNVLAIVRRHVAAQEAAEAQAKERELRVPVIIPEESSLGHLTKYKKAVRALKEEHPLRKALTEWLLANTAYASIEEWLRAENPVQPQYVCLEGRSFDSIDYQDMTLVKVVKVAEGKKVVEKAVPNVAEDGKVRTHTFVQGMDQAMGDPDDYDNFFIAFQTEVAGKPSIQVYMLNEEGTQFFHYTRIAERTL